MINNAKTKMRIFFAVIFLSAIIVLAEDKPEKINLGPGINSPYHEIAPIISPDEKVLFFTRQYHPENKGYWNRKYDQDCWVSRYDSATGWSEAVNLGAPINNANPNAVASVSPDGNTLLLLGSYVDNNSGFSISHRTLTGWSKPEKLDIPDYYSLGVGVSANLTGDGKVLLLSLKREDGLGENDIYVCYLKDGGSWTKPVNIGKPVNTPGSEYGQFLASDGVTMYFVSDGHGGYGEVDIFVTRRLDDSYLSWSEPENLGGTINTRGRDSYYFIPASGEYAYFSTTDSGFGGMDIFKIRLPEAARPKPVLLISGKVFNSETSDPIGADVFYEYLPGGAEAGIARSNPADGSYKITLPAGSKYGFRAQSEGFLSVNDFIDADTINAYREIHRDLYLTPVKKGGKITLHNVFFDYNESELRSESYPELKRIAEFLKKNPKMKIRIGGHTDDVGSKYFNKKLSAERAKSVAEYIVSLGVPTERITRAGYGEEKPVVKNDSDENRQKNRRVEFEILEK